MNLAHGRPPSDALLDAVRRRLEEVRQRIAGAGGDPLRTRIVAVTKGQPFAAAVAASRLGLVDLGENYADELVGKAVALRTTDAEPQPIWHFLGAIQRNKLARLAPIVAVYEGVDRLEEAEAIAQRAPGAAVLVEVNAAEMAGRGGVRPDEVAQLCARISDLPLELRGLMTVAPQGDPVLAARAFAMVGKLATHLELPERSMGMSDDFELAVAAGSTMLRLGRALFGPRPVSETVPQ